MDVRELAKTVVEYCEQGRELDLIKDHYAEDAVSIEAVNIGSGVEFQGHDEIAKKRSWIMENFKLNDMKMDAPKFHGAYKFMITFHADTTDVMTDSRDTVSVTCVYTVLDGKIVREEFFL